VKSDTASVRGERSLENGDLSTLLGFDFNAGGKLSTTLYAPYTVTVNRVTGELEVTIPPFTPSLLVSSPTGATHFKLVMAGTSLSFSDATFERELADSGFLATGNTATAAQTLTANLTANTTGVLMVVLGIQFYQEVNGQKYVLNNGGNDALGVVAVEQ
jgi:hypothetical protein